MATSQGMHVIVGGLGGLGRCLQQQLLAHGKKVRVLDLAPSAQAAASRLVHPKSVEYVHCDVSTIQKDSPVLENALKDAETVYSVVTPDVMKGSVASMKRTNVNGVQNLLDACQTVGVPKLVYASSMAVTNLLLDHNEDNEETPLPDWDTYKITYDITKRQGEELVLQAHSDNLQTCSLRLGTVMAGPGDYSTRHMMGTPGKVYIMSGKFGRLLDVSSAHDLSNAFRLASNKLDETNSPVGGRAIFTTKCKTNQPTTTPEMMELYAHQWNWKTATIPEYVLPAMAKGYRAKESLKGLFGLVNEENTPGYPFDLVIESCVKQLTFDNSLARELLGYEPEETWEEAVVRIAKECQEAHPEIFPAAKAAA